MTNSDEWNNLGTEDKGDQWAQGGSPANAGANPNSAYGQQENVSANDAGTGTAGGFDVTKGPDVTFSPVGQSPANQINNAGGFGGQGGQVEQTDAAEGAPYAENQGLNQGYSQGAQSEGTADNVNAMGTMNTTGVMQPTDPFGLGTADQAQSGMGGRAVPGAVGQANQAGQVAQTGGMASGQVDAARAQAQSTIDNAIDQFANQVPGGTMMAQQAKDAAGNLLNNMEQEAESQAGNLGQNLPGGLGGMLGGNQDTNRNTNL